MKEPLNDESTHKKMDDNMKKHHLSALPMFTLVCLRIVKDSIITRECQVSGF